MRYVTIVPVSYDLVLRFLVKPPILSLRTTFLFSWSALRESGWKTFSFLVVEDFAFLVSFLEVLVGAMMMVKA